MYDVVVIGAGPVGLACAIEAQRQDKTACVLDKGALGNSIFGYGTAPALQLDGVHWKTEE